MFGAVLLLYAIPANVRMIPGALPYPALFPQIAAWLFIALGLIQVFFVNAQVQVPSARRILFFGLAAVLTLAALLLVDRLGYLPVMIALMAGVVWMVRERRWAWVAVVVLGLPVGIWLLFEQVLQRPLP
ncbi:tripartite tricarboxylate transporter TctB family protein [Chelativorans sp. AA-79]|uniref:tripartite tricarboxylate transporter TctB family protein n=1 Tax=Chelativorans sp. AA-79 TaxID=3028735 RepID=UPI0023F99A1B|nr:tripartite tricarboxylate transporter TctB family protein [Chelativorans sp. AA-79]WEX08098.1 tripartite tricarboxylate transporter TctB family protein [Chelativorans sp. AA-79]